MKTSARSVAFDGWREVSAFAVPGYYVPLPVARAETWLLRTGWELGGPKISLHERPGRFGA